MRIHFVNGKMYSIVDPRGMDAAMNRPADTVKVDFDDQRWKLGYRAINSLQSVAEVAQLPQEDAEHWIGILRRAQLVVTAAPTK